MIVLHYLAFLMFCFVIYIGCPVLFLTTVILGFIIYGLHLREKRHVNN